MTYRIQQQRNIEDGRRKEEAAKTKELVKNTVQYIMMCTQEYAESAERAERAERAEHGVHGAQG